MTNLTANEKAFLTAWDKNCPRDCGAAAQKEDNCTPMLESDFYALVPKTSVGGVLASLSKKGLAELIEGSCGEIGELDAWWLTDKGIDVIYDQELFA